MNAPYLPFFSVCRLFALLAVGLAVAAPAAPTNIVTQADKSLTTPAVSAPATNAAFDLEAIERDRILAKANAALAEEPVTITKYRGPYSRGGPNDFYTMGDSWFPDPASTNGMPYKQRPGEVNPENFNAHKKCLWQLQDNVAALAAAYQITGKSRYATVAAEWLRVFFIDPSTRMNPSLEFAQAVPGVFKGRSLGVSDALPLVEVAKAVEVLQKSPNFSPEILEGMKDWASNYVAWLTVNVGENSDGLSNNHTLIYWLQVATFAELIGDQDQVADSRTHYELFLLPGQINADGSFNKGGKFRTYSTAVAQMDDLAVLAQQLSTPGDNLWHFKSANDRNVRMAVDYMYPFIEDRSQWPKLDPQEEGWPGRRVGLLFAGLAYNEPRYIALWKKFPAEPPQDDVRRYTIATQPILWVK